MQAYLGSFLGPKVCVPPSLSGRTAVITGGALGLGFEITKSFVKAGARVIMVSRKEEHSDEAMAKLRAEVGDKVDVEWVRCDLGDLAMVKEVFDGLAKNEERLDILILCAGLMVNTFGVSHDGNDRHFSVNWLGHYLATNRLYPLIRKTSRMPDTPPPRVVFVASEHHRFSPSVVHFGSKDEINDPTLSPNELYGRSKLAGILGMKYGLLGKVITPNNDNIYALSCHPGSLKTDMQEQWTAGYGVLGLIPKYLTMSFGRTPEQGTYPVIYAATDPEVQVNGWNGYYLQDPSRPGKETAQASDPKLGAALWELSQRMVKDVLGEDGLLPWTDVAA